MLEIVSTRTPVDAPTLTGPLGRAFRSQAYGDESLPRRSRSSSWSRTASSCPSRRTCTPTSRTPTA
ncbi:hypothetical protein ACFQ9X_33935 [Catenulispora yoronensis]